MCSGDSWLARRSEMTRKKGRVRRTAATGTTRRRPACAPDPDDPCGFGERLGAGAPSDGGRAGAAQQRRACAAKRDDPCGFGARQVHRVTE